MSESENFGDCLRRAIVTTGVAFALLAGSWPTTADVSAVTDRQGRLRDLNGQPLPTGDKLKLRISIWDGPAASSSQVGKAMVYDSVPVLDGYLNVLVGPLKVETINDPDRYIGIEIGRDGGEFGPKVFPRHSFHRPRAEAFAMDCEPEGDDTLVMSANSDVYRTNRTPMGDFRVAPDGARLTRYSVPGSEQATVEPVGKNIYLRLYISDSALNAEILADGQSCGARDDTPGRTSSAHTVRPDPSQRGWRARDVPSKLSFTDCATQTEIPEIECDALVAFYNGTNGADWIGSQNWLTGPIDSWTGVILGGDVLRLSDDRPAFVEVAGPGGTDPCGPGAVSTDGCAEVGGNAVVQSPNSTGEYLLSANDALPGPEEHIGTFWPNDFELRFTGGTSVAWHLFTTNRIMQVPFELWDIGPTNPFGVNDPGDDVRLVPILFSDGGGECAFGYGETVDFVNGLPATDRIYAYYPRTTYDDWEAAALPLIQASPDDCPTIDFSFGDSHVDLNRGRPLQRLVLADVGGSAVLPASGTVIRFYTKDVRHVARLNEPAENVSGALPPALGDLQQLELLSISNHRMTTPIPPELGNLQNLWFLYLSSDVFAPLSGFGLTGPLPPELGNLHNLQYLWLGGNRLSGTIPPELGDLQNLLELDLELNEFTGPIPAQLGNLQNLEYLTLGDELSGTIPPELGNLQNLRTLTVGGELSGAIPPELGNLQNLEVLRLGGGLSGAIPPELGNLQYLWWLHLAHNQLSGAIPPELGNLQYLEELYLANNQLSGAIPPELGTLQNLHWVHFADNQLSGSIPPELGNLSSLHVLDLSNNDLGDIVPHPVAALGAALGLDCHLTGNLPSLIIPDTPEYTTLTTEPGICGLPFSPLTCPDSAIDLRISGGPGPALHWDPVAGASGYDVIRGDLGPLRQVGSPGQLGVVSCLANDTNETMVPIAPGDLDSGEPSFYLVRPIDGSQSTTYGFASDCGAERAVESGDCATTASAAVNAGHPADADATWHETLRSVSQDRQQYFSDCRERATSFPSR